MGTTTAPVAGSGSWPVCIAAVSKRIASVIDNSQEARELSDLNTTNEAAHIVVVGQWRQGHTRLPTAYVHAVEIAGGTPRVLSTFRVLPVETVPEGLDISVGVDPYDASGLDGAVGLLIPGGGDIDPDWYGCPRHPKTHNVNHRRDRFELTLLAAALERDMPILAVCHGMQLLNVHLGGTLEQHLADSPQRLEHDRDMPRAEPSHELRVKERSLLASILGQTHATVNSHHHQGLERIAAPLEEVGWAEDGVLEAVVMSDHRWVVGVQWHPEVMAPVDAVQRRLFQAFVDATRDYAVASGVESDARSA